MTEPVKYNIPDVVYDMLEDLFLELGDEHRVAVMNGSAEEGLIMNGAILIRGVDEDADMLVNSGRLTDYIHDVAEEAFYAGRRTAHKDAAYAWANYVPSPHLQRLGEDL